MTQWTLVSCEYKDSHANISHCRQSDYELTTLFHKYDRLGEPTLNSVIILIFCIFLYVFQFPSTPIHDLLKRTLKEKNRDNMNNLFAWLTPSLVKLISSLLCILCDWFDLFNRCFTGKESIVLLDVICVMCPSLILLLVFTTWIVSFLQLISCL